MSVMKKYLLIAIAAMAASCYEGTFVETPTGIFPSRYFTQRYVKTERIEVEQLGYGNSIHVVFSGISVGGDYNREFVALAEHFGDNNYNKGMMPFTTESLANEFTAIDITSNRDFNGISAGESLASEVRLCAASPLKFIESGYTETFDWDADKPAEFNAEDWESGIFGNHREGYHPVNKLLSEVTRRDLTLLRHEFVFLQFTDPPVGQLHRLTISMRDGEALFSTSVEVEF